MTLNCAIIRVAPIPYLMPCCVTQLHSNPSKNMIVHLLSVPSLTHCHPWLLSIYLASVLGLAPHQSMFSSPIALANLKLTLALATVVTNNTSTTIQAAVDPSTTSQSDESFIHLGSNRRELSNLKLHDPTLKDIHKYLSAGRSNKSALRHLSSREQTRIQNLARHCVILDGLVMYSDDFLDDPCHFRIFVPDNKDLKTKLLPAYHDSPIGMHRGRETYHSLAQDFY